MQFNIAQTKL